MKRLVVAWMTIVYFSLPLSAQEPTISPPDLSGIEGTLVICGGGHLPETIMDRFLQAAGGPQAKLVLIPTASNLADRVEDDWFLSSWRERGVRSVTVLHTRSRETADRTDFIAPLRHATGVWIYGGNQSRLAETYVGTLFEQELNALLKRGGAIGGTSAGAAIMSRLMIARGRQQPEFGVGFDLLPDAVIDQHFLRRGRQPRLLAALEMNPDHFGVGIDEGTALVVQGSNMRVIGESVVTVCLAAAAGREAREVTLSSGAEADLPTFRRAARNLTAVNLIRPGDPLARTSSLSETSGAR